MRKALFTLVLTLISITNASAQLEEGNKYLGINFNGLDLSYSEATDFSLAIGVDAGYMVKNNLLVIGTADIQYRFSDLKMLELGGKMRYFLGHTGIFLGIGAKFVHENTNYNDFQVSPELGYCYFINNNITIQPRFYYDASFSNFDEKSRFGFSFGLGYFF